MRTPLSYYGGKQQLASKIVSIMPEHKIYVEPFVGGAAVFFAKQKSKVEIINDINSEIINFYDVLQRDFSALQSEVNVSLHSRKLHQHARVVYENPEMFDRIKRAWAVWVLANMSFNNSIKSNFTQDKQGKLTRSLKMKRDNFTEELAIRIQNVQIECCDALRIIRSRNSVDTFFYIDPPYVGACQGHYDGYMQEDFDNLISELANIDGKFLLSSYRNESLTKAVKQCGWHQIELKINNHPSAKVSPSRTKIEVLTANYPIGVDNGEVKIL